MFRNLFASLVPALAGAVLALAVTGAHAAADANKATQAELESIQGIGPGTAGRILEERKKSPFKNWDDLVGRVKGVGEGNAAKFSAAGLTVNGSTYTAPAPADKPAKVAKADKKEAPKEAHKADAKGDAKAAAKPAAASAPAATK
jgi:competence protein ComEA